MPTCFRLRTLAPLVVAAVALTAPARRARAQAQPPAAAIPATANYTAADVAFMQGMIGHHSQALTMAALVADRSTRSEIVLLAERISVSQRDEIAIMQGWLAMRNQAVPTSDGMHAEHVGHGMPAMPGMLSPAQMDSLSATRGADFDRLFLRLMIQHHEGALTMVADLLKTTNAAREPMVFQFVSDVDTDQRAEIRRMQALLATIS